MARRRSSRALWTRVSNPYEGYSATYAYVRESNMQGERRDGGGSKEKQSKAEGTWKRVAGGQASL